MKQEYQEQIDKYVLDQMDNAERTAFEQEAAQDTELQEQLQFTQDVASATKSREEKLTKMQDWKDDYAMDDEGLLPKELKRGVLSEDGIWNLLTDSRELNIRMLETVVQILKGGNV